MFRFLPYYFKWIGLSLFVLAGLPSWVRSFLIGFTGGASLDDPVVFTLPDFYSSQIFMIVSYLGLLIYALSKDKVFDEFLVRLRLESLYLVFFGTLIFILVRMIIGGDWEMSASYLFEAQVIFYLIINKVRKVAFKYQL